MQPQDDRLRAVIFASLKGDKSAYRALLLALTPVVQGYLARRVRTGREDVENLVQDTLAAIHARRLTCDRTRPQMLWVYAIAHHKFFDWMRKRRVTSLLDDGGFEPVIDSFEDSSNAAMDTERLLATLPPKQAAAIRATNIASPIESMGCFCPCGPLGMTSLVHTAKHTGLRLRLPRAITLKFKKLPNSLHSFNQMRDQISNCSHRISASVAD